MMFSGFLATILQRRKKPDSRSGNRSTRCSFEVGWEESVNERTAPLVRAMSVSDLDWAIELRWSEGWNQTRNDWARILAYDPLGCFVAVVDGELAGTVTTTRYGHQLAWIGMMLVRSDFRRRGIGVALMNTALEYLRERKVSCVKLDATPLGEPLYTHLGFEPEWSFHRWERPSVERPRLRTDDVEFSITDSQRDLDRLSFGVDRAGLISVLGKASSTIVGDDGFAMAREGRRAVYLGPVVATSPAGAQRMVEAMAARAEGPLFWDIPGPNRAAGDLARSLGFHPVRDLTRMWLGDRLISPDLNHLFAIAGPAVG